MVERHHAMADMQQLLLNLHTDVPPSLENFVVGANAHVLSMLASCPGGRALYLWGEAGVGRTHLLQAVTHSAHAYYADANTCVQVLESLLHAPITAQMRVAVDDVQTLDDAGQAALFNLYNRWRAQAATADAFCVITAGDRSPLALPLREDLRTRLAWDLVFRLHTLSDQERAQALHQRAAQRGVVLAPEVLPWLLTHHSRDMRRLCALLDALDRYSLQTLKPITLPLLKRVLAHDYTQDYVETSGTF